MQMSTSFLRQCFKFLHRSGDAVDVVRTVKNHQRTVQEVNALPTPKLSSQNGMIVQAMSQGLFRPMPSHLFQDVKGGIRRANIGPDDEGILGVDVVRQYVNLKSWAKCTSLDVFKAAASRFLIGHPGASVPTQRGRRLLKIPPFLEQWSECRNPKTPDGPFQCW